MTGKIFEKERTMTDDTKPAIANDRQKPHSIDKILNRARLIWAR